MKIEYEFEEYLRLKEEKERLFVFNKWKSTELYLNNFIHKIT